MTVQAKRIVVVGAGLGGLTAAALLARAGHEVTVIEAHDWVGGKSRRIEVAGQRIDTGPSLVTFPAVFDTLFERYDALGARASRLSAVDARHIAGLELERLPEVGRYVFGTETVDLPVPDDHPWFPAWQRFVAEHAPLSGDVVTLLTSRPLDPWALPSAARLLRRYGARLSTRAYLDGLDWMPDGLREVIAIHTLNAGVAPEHTLALYASMPAMMAVDGISVPRGGVNEIPLALARLSEHAGATIRTGVSVTAVERGRVSTTAGEMPADIVVSGVDTSIIDGLLGRPVRRPEQLSCSGVGVFVVFEEPLPEDTVTHSVVMPSDPAALHASLERRAEPGETMAFVNYYRPGHVYPNDHATAAILLTAPANGERYDLDSPFVARELERISAALGLNPTLRERIAEHVLFDPEYFSEFGAAGGALYGRRRPLWQSGPFQRPGYHSVTRPWLWRVGASVHPGGGIPAVLGGAMNATELLLKRIGVASAS
ncbi:MAG TPA: FAD-dependent oxidoreductase [Microbacteriaceae bacterium]|nr:FAD-dependent oxidoreductase [Microbacteriaceae bacterium]